MQKMIFTLAALLIASAVFVSCSSDDESDRWIPAPKTYTMTINASKGDDAQEIKGGTNRALTLEGSTLSATWTAGDEVSVHNDTRGADLGGSLDAQTTGASTTLSGALTGTIEVGDVLTLKYKSPSYDTQNGTLAGIAANCDYATATVTVASVAGGVITTTADATFTNQQAIVKFSLKDMSNGDAAIAVPNLQIQVFSVYPTTYDVYNLTSSASEVYVAIPGFSNQTIRLTGYSSGNNYIYERANTTLENGHYYEIGVKMFKRVNLSTTYENYVAPNGVALENELMYNVKISIADGATVMLNGATINGINNDGCHWGGITSTGNSTIILSGVNTVTGFYSSYPGIHVQSGTLTIKGAGTLTASSNGHGCGIGGGNGVNSGSIVIQGGTINASGTGGCAGIGGGSSATCGYISITGGTVTATGVQGAGIGSGHYGHCGNIYIGLDSGSVNAEGSTYAAGIGTGSYGFCGNINVAKGTVTALGSSSVKDIGKGQGGTIETGYVTVDASVVTNAGKHYTGNSTDGYKQES